MGAAGDRTALIGNHVTVSHAELVLLASETAAGLARRGVGPGRVVAVAFGSTPDLVVALLGVWATGACAVPLNSHWWPREITAVLDAVAPDLVLRAPGVNIGDHLSGLATADHGASGEVVLVPPGTDAATMLAPLREPAVGPAPIGPLASLVSAEAELWAPTTGCTGEPRMFGFDAEQLAEHWFAPLAEAPRTVACWTDAAHAPTLRLVLGALAGGAAVQLTERWAPRRALSALGERPVDLLWATAPQLARAARSMPTGPAPTAGGRRLAHHVVAIGGPLHPPVARQVAERFGFATSVRYTSTEAGGWLTEGHRHDPAGDSWSDARPEVVAVPAGALAPGVEATIEPVDADPAGDGRGELHVAGPASARRTGGRERRPRPAHGWPTGDLAVIGPGGQVGLLGRLADRYLCDGHLVVPLEVELALGADPRVAEVVVVPRPDPVRGAIGVAVTVPADPEAPPFLADLAERLAPLPPEAHPAAQCVIAELPLSAAGHVHRRLLAFEEASR